MSGTDDLDALVTELNSAAADKRAPTMTMGGCRARADGRQRKRSVAGQAHRSIRVDGWCRSLKPLGGDEIADAVVPALPPHAPHVLITVSRIRRFAAGTARGSVSICIVSEAGPPRFGVCPPPALSTSLLPTIEALSLPRGLVVIGGPTGSGKTTTLAAR